MRPLKILHLLSYHLYTGPAEPVLRLAAAQRAHGHDARLACDTLRAGDMAERARQFGVPLQAGLVLSVKAGPRLLLRDVLALGRMWREEEFDVLHAHRTHDHTLAVLSRPRRSATVLVRTLHGEGAAARGRRWLLRRSDGLIAVSRGQLERLRERGLAARALAIAVEGVVDGRVFFPLAEDLTVRRELGLAEQQPVAGMVARMKEGRGHRELLSAWREVAGRIPSARLLLAGRGEMEADLRRLAGELGLLNSVLFVGYRSDLPSLYRALDLKIMLAPGNDGTCRAALEAMACGVPVLAARRGALAEIVSPGKSGFLVPAGDEAALAQELCRALAQRENLRLMGKWAAEQAPLRFSLDRQMEMVMDLYRRLVFSPGRPSMLR